MFLIKIVFYSPKQVIITKMYYFLILGNFGKCYLHFTRKRDQDEEKAASEILTALSSLSLNVKCELVKRENKENGGEGNESQNESRIETTDVTAV